jgi:hypothetical protein
MLCIRNNKYILLTERVKIRKKIFHFTWYYRHFSQFDEKEIGFCLVIRAALFRLVSKIIMNIFSGYCTLFCFKNQFLHVYYNLWCCHQLWLRWHFSISYIIENQCLVLYFNLFCECSKYIISKKYKHLTFIY